MTDTQIRVSNINWTASADEIKTFLSQFVKIQELKLIYDRQ